MSSNVESTFLSPAAEGKKLTEERKPRRVLKMTSVLAAGQTWARIRCVRKKPFRLE